MHSSAAPDPAAPWSAGRRSPAPAGVRERVSRAAALIATDERWTRAAKFALIGLTALVLLRTAWKVMRGEGISATGEATMPEFLGTGEGRGDARSPGS